MSKPIRNEINILISAKVVYFIKVTLLIVNENIILSTSFKLLEVILGLIKVLIK